jgi:hypothetical protein
MRPVILLVAAVLVLTACAAPPDERPRPTPTKLLFEDQHLRQVRMTSGRALGYVQPETASQILCQLLEKEDWERLLDGRIGRKPLNAPSAGCQIATEQGMVSMQLIKRDKAFEAKTTIAGRPATKDENSSGSPTFTLALTDDALQPAPRQYYPARQLLELQVISGDAEERVDVGTRVLNEITPLLVKEGEPLPDIDAQGHVRYVSTPLAKPEEFVDLPEPVQALQLCTLMQEEPSVRVTARQVDVFDTGRCVLSTEQGTVGVEAQQVPYPPDYPDRIAGRPAWTPTDPPVATVRLRDDADVQLYVSASDSIALAEKLVPLLVG